MTTKPRKPILVNLTWAVGALLGLTVLYVLSYGAAHWLNGNGSLRTESLNGLENTVYAPLHSYSRSGVLGGRTVSVFKNWCFWYGAGYPAAWADIEGELEQYP